MSELEQYVDHPRYGCLPRVTGRNPDPLDPNVHLHWNTTNPGGIEQRFQALTGIPWPHGDLSAFSRVIKRIPNTAIIADLARQTAATVPVTHYFDMERTCRDCDRPFIFFAEEQKYWYEDLGFGLDSDCVRCALCRKRQQGLARKRERYEELFYFPNRTTDEDLEMADCCLSLIEASAFHTRQTERVRMLLKRASSERDQKTDAQLFALLARVLMIESTANGG